VPSEGVLLFGSNRPEFELAFKHGRAKGYDPLLPYTVVIQNNTDQEIIAYSVVWNCRDAAGKFTRALRNVSGLHDLTPGTKLVPHSTQIVSLLIDLEAGGTSWDSNTEGMVERHATFFSSRAAVDIALDAVMFADGSTIGADTAHCIPHWKAYMEAEQEVFTKATQTPPASLRTVLNQLAAPGMTLAKELNMDVTHPGQLGVMAGRIKDYSEILQMEKAYFALSILDEIDNTNLPTIENLRSILAKKKYPEVHNKYADLKE